MKKLLFALLLVPGFMMAQTKTAATNSVKTEVESKDGMKFEHGSWTEILAKAKAENKYIIMDCFTTWCGPCKFMDANIFPLKESGDFFNANYLNVKVQFDSTANDSEEVKAWKKDMKMIEKEYAINAYPTYLIFDPNGNAVHRAVGSTLKAVDFIARGKAGMVPETQYYTQLKKYTNGEKDPAFLRKMALMAADAYDTKSAAKISSEYMASMTDMFTKENIEFISKFTSKSSDRGFALMMENGDKVDAIIGQGKTKSKLTGIILTEEVLPGIRKVNSDKTITSPDYTAIVAAAVKKYPAFSNEITDYTEKTKINYYLSKKEWSGFKNEVLAYMSKYGENKLTPAELNSYAWGVFENCKDMTCVTEALDWSRKSFKDKDNHMYLDTYANILHKMGRTKEAIEAEEKALAMIPDTDPESKKTYQATIDKMKKGEKTWSDEK